MRGVPGWLLARTGRATRLGSVGLLLMGLVVAMTATATAFASPSAVATWGSNEWGRLGDGLTPSEQLYSDVAVQVSGITEAVQVAEGCHHDLARLADGTVMAWGANQYGQLGLGTKSEYVDKPTLVGGLGNVIQVAAGCNFSVALLASHEVRVWGQGLAGSEYGEGKLEGAATPHNPGGQNSEIEAIAANDFTALALGAGGTIEWWGEVYGWRPGAGEPDTADVHQLTPLPGVSGAVALAQGGSEGKSSEGGLAFSTALLANGTVEVVGTNFAGQHGDAVGLGRYGPCHSEACEREGAYGPSVVPSMNGVSEIAAAAGHLLARTKSNEVYEWGALPAAPISDMPSMVTGEATAISTGAAHSLASLASGKLVTWGSNGQGGLGDGRNEAEQPSSATPVDVAGLSETARVANASSALGSAAPPTLRTFTAWTTGGALTDAALRASIPLTGRFSGAGALHGQMGGEVEVPAEPVTFELGGAVPVTLGVGLEPLAWDGGADARANIHLSSLAIFGLTIPTNCTTRAPVSFDTRAPIENGSKLELSGTTRVSRFRCEGGFLGEAFSAIASLLMSGPENAYSVMLEP
jgi:alpha-tubulin suppressor-like RCC1 family protein